MFIIANNNILIKTPSFCLQIAATAQHITSVTTTNIEALAYCGKTVRTHYLAEAATTTNIGSLGQFVLVIKVAEPLFQMGFRVATPK